MLVFYNLLYKICKKLEHYFKLLKESTYSKYKKLKYLKKSDKDFKDMRKEK